MRKYEECRSPGLDKKLSDSWLGPFEVTMRLNTVNYRIRGVTGKGRTSVVHMNSLKQYLEKKERVSRLVLVGEFVDEVEVKEQEPRWVRRKKWRSC